VWAALLVAEDKGQLQFDRKLIKKTIQDPSVLKLPPTSGCLLPGGEII
jgi:hypothetical protein